MTYKRQLYHVVLRLFIYMDYEKQQQRLLEINCQRNKTFSSDGFSNWYTKLKTKQL